MSGGQLAALIFAILLLLPGGCFLLLGVNTLLEDHPDSIDREIGPLAFTVGLGLALLVALLFWFALRRRRVPEAAESTSPPPDTSELPPPAA